MCKYPAPECKPIEEELEDEGDENETAGEDNAMSEDDDEVSDDDDSDESYYTESSVNYRSDSESEAESASGHRVTPNMVLLLMLKEHGAISEEKYAEKAEKCAKNFKFLIPNLPRYSTDSPDYTKDLELDSNDDTEVNENKDLAEKEEVNNVNKDNVGTSEVECGKDVTKDRKVIEFIEKVKESDPCDTLNDHTNRPVDDISSCDVVKNDIHMSVDDISKCDIVDDDKNVFIDEVSTNHCDEETLSLQQQEVDSKNSNQTKDVTEKCQQDIELEVKEERQKTEQAVSSPDENIENTVIEASNKECESSIVPECIDTELTPSKDDDIIMSEVKDEHIIELNNLLENDLELAEDKSKESNNNTNQDRTNQDVLPKPAESKTKNKKPETNNPTGKITKSFKYILTKLIRENRIPKEDEDDRISDDYGEDYGSHLLSFANGLDRDYENNTHIEFSDDSEDDNRQDAK